MKRAPANDPNLLVPEYGTIVAAFADWDYEFSDPLEAAKAAGESIPAALRQPCKDALVRVQGMLESSPELRAAISQDFNVYYEDEDQLSFLLHESASHVDSP